MERKFLKSDQVYLSKRAIVAEELNLPDLWNVVDQFGLYAGVQTIGTRLAVFEILKQTLNIPGHIAEFGCWNGANLMFMAKALQLLQPNTLKNIYGFDGFEGLQTFSSEDGSAIETKGKYKGNEEVLRKMIDFFEFDEWVHLIKGNALETIPQFFEKNSHIMFSLVYLDFDLYAPTKVALEYLANRIVPGGIIVFDEAFLDNWPGEGQALIEYLSTRNLGEFKMFSVPFSRQPTAYLVKQ